MQLTNVEPAEVLEKVKIEFCQRIFLPTMMATTETGMTTTIMTLTATKMTTARTTSLTKMTTKWTTTMLATITMLMAEATTGSRRSGFEDKGCYDLDHCCSNKAVFFFKFFTIKLEEQ